MTTNSKGNKMAQEPRQTKRKPPRLILIPGILFLLLGSTCGCGGLRSFFPSETRAPEEFPDAEIVFLADSGVGFVDADGLNATSIPFEVNDIRGKASDWWRPVMTGDNQTMIVKVDDYYHYEFDPGLLAAWRAGEFPVLCQQWGLQQMPYLAADQGSIFIRTEQGMALYELASCGTDQAPIQVYENVFGIPSPDLQTLAYINSTAGVDDRFLVLRDLASGGEHTAGIGDDPAWSRDSQWLAYTGKDGIYIVNAADGAEPKRVILYPNLIEGFGPTYSGNAYWDIPPEVSWSPDGKWLVYHKWTGTDTNFTGRPRDNAIYKLNIETGQETKILDGGMYPSWRWPAQP